MNLMFYIFTFLEFFTILFLIKRKIKRVNNVKAIIFDPFIFFSLCWLFMYNLVPLLMVGTNSYYYTNGYSNYSVIISKVQLLAYYFSVLFFYLLLRKILNFREGLTFLKLKRLKFSEKFFLNSYNVLTLIVSIFYLKYIFSFGIGNYFQNRIILNKGIGIFTLIIFSSNILILCLFFNNYYKKTKTLLSLIRKGWILTIVLLYVSIYLLIGSRLSVLLLVLQIIFGLVYLKSRIERKFIIRIIVLSFVLITLMSFFGFIRVRVNLEGANLYKEFAKVYSEKITENIVANFGKYENLLWLNDNSEEWSAQRGKTFLAGFINFMPRKLWENKPLGGGPTIRNWIKPGTYDLNSKSVKNITSYTTGLPTEAYMNFHLLGFLIVPFFFAIALTFLKVLQNNLNGNIIQLSLYIYLLVSFCFVFQYGEFLGVFSRTLFVISPFFLIWIMSNFNSKIRIRR